MDESQYQRQKTYPFQLIIHEELRLFAYIPVHVERHCQKAPISKVVSLLQLPEVASFTGLKIWWDKSFELESKLKVPNRPEPRLDLLGAFCERSHLIWIQVVDVSLVMIVNAPYSHGYLLDTIFPVFIAFLFNLVKHLV